MTLKSKIVILDIDETIGYFVELGIFWDSLIHNIDGKQMLSQNDFNNVLDLYPEFMRPDIMSIFHFLKNKKESKQCQGVVIYTNNQGPKEWAYYIKNYIEEKLQYKLFDQMICAFKINGKRVELNRTSHDKSIKDLIKCTKLPQNTEFCYIDDTYYPDMVHDNVYYIKIKPYTHDLHFDVMIHRFINSPIDIAKTILEMSTKQEFTSFMQKTMSQYEFIYLGKNKEEYEIDKIITKKTMEYLQIFFNKKISPRTKTASKKHSKTNKSKTKKIYY